MSSKYLQLEEYELSRESSRESQDGLDFHVEDDNYQSHLLTGQDVSLSRYSAACLLFKSLIPRSLHPRPSRRRSKRRLFSPSWTCSRRSIFGKFVLLSYTFLATIVSLTIVGGVFFPSYTRLPKHYQNLQDQVHSSTAAGRGNPTQEKIFIATSIYDHGGDLAGGAWSKNLLGLIDLLGPSNVYLSIYENDSGSVARKALQDFEYKITCNRTFRFDEHLALENLPHVSLPDGSKRVKRIAYLAEARNRALLPLEKNEVRFDKLLYLNDIVFDPVDAVQLLFSTNADENGQANYRAACAVDFINAFKFYDTFATRDMEGYSMGVPFFPWFSASGEAQSRQEVIAGKDAVQVRSCWGGMIAFDAKYFQNATDGEFELDTAGNRSPKRISRPYRFRAEEDLFWDASECCLIHADIQSNNPGNTGIFMNPFVRVAYTTKTLSWLRFTRRFERLYPPIHFLVDILVGFPRENPRRDERPWDSMEDSVWVSEESSPFGGSFQAVERIADHAGFCGGRKLLVMKTSVEEGEKNWEEIPIPT